MPERITRVDLTKINQEVAKKPINPKNEQVIPEDVKKVGDFEVVHEDIVFIPPKPLFSRRRSGTW